MAQVRTEDAPSIEPSTTVPGDYQNIRATPDSFGGLIAGGEQRLGAGAEAAGNNLAQAYLLKAQRHNEIAGDAADNDFQKRVLDLTSGPNGLFIKRGSDALTAVPQTKEALESARAQILGSLQNDAQKLEFSKISRRFLTFQNEAIDRFYDQQQHEWGLATNQATEDVQRQAIAARYNSDTDFGNSLNQIRIAAVKSLHIVQGDNATDDMVTAALDRVDSKAIADRALAWGADNPDAAMRWLDGGTMPNPVPGQPDVPVKARIEPQTYQLLKQHFQAKGDAAAGSAAADRALTASPAAGPVPTMITQAATAAGVAPIHALAVAKIESDLGQRPDTPGNVHTGIFQTGPEEKVAYRGPVSPVTGIPAPRLATVTAPGGAAFRVDESAAPKFQGLVADLAAEGIKIKPETSGGYNDRFIAGTHTPSQHARGLAVDINWDENPNGEGKPSAIPAEVANRLAQKWGLTWGGNWSGKDRDPMHFEVSQPPGPDRSEEIATGVNGLKHAAHVADTALGRPSEPWEQYVTYQQGDTGGPLLLKSNPTISAVDALASAYGGDKARALQKIVANGGTADMTAGQFTGMWRAKYQDAKASVSGQAVPGNAVPPPSPQTESIVMQSILDDPTLKDRPQAMEHALTLAKTRFSIIRQERVDAAEKAGSSLVSQMLKDPLQIKLTDIADNPNFTAEHRWSLSRMWAESVAGTRGDKQATEYGPGIYKYLQMVVPQPSRQEAAPLNQLGQSTGPAQTVGGGPALNDPTELWSKVPTGELTIAGVEKLTSIMQGSKTMEGQNDNRMLTQFIDATKTLISKHGAFGGTMKDPRGEQLFVNFLTQALPAFAAGRQAGIPAASLVNSDSKDFVGKIIPQFVRSDAQILKDLHDANGADDKPAAEEAGVDLTTSAGIMAAFEAKKVSYARAERALELLGVPHAQPAAPAPPTAVPTGQ